MYRRRHGRARRSGRVLLLAAMATGIVLYLVPAARAASALTITKSANPADGLTVDPGDTIEYTIVVANAGPDAATGVTFTDPTPANTTYVAGSATIDDGTAINASTNPFQSGLLIADIPSGQDTNITFDVTVNVPTPDGTPITNTARVYASNDPAATQANPKTSTTTHTVTAPDLSVDKTASPAAGDAVQPGDTIIYTIVVANDLSATGTATGVVFTDPTPADTTYVAGSASEDGTPITGSSNPFESGYLLPDLAPGDEVTLEFEVLVDSPLDNGTEITNTATVESDQTTPVTSETVHTVESAPVLTIEKTSLPAEGGQVIPGTEITYTIVVTNESTATEVADELVLTDPTPANTTYVAGSATLNGSPVSGAGNPLASGLDLPELGPDESHTIVFRVRVNRPLPDGTVIANLARLTADNHPEVEDSASHTVDSTAVLTVDGSSTSPRPGRTVEPGDRIRYVFRISNDPSATGSLLGVVFTDPTPEDTSYIAGSSRLDGALVQDTSNPFALGFPLGTIAPGDTRIVQFDVRVKPSAQGAITNTATASATNHPAVPVTIRHPLRAAAGAGGAGGAGAGGAGGVGGQAAAGTAGFAEAGDGLAVTGLALARLLMLAIALFLAGWTLLSRGRGLHRRSFLVTTASEGAPPEPRFPWDGAWFYPPPRRRRH